MTDIKEACSVPASPALPIAIRIVNPHGLLLRLFACLSTDSLNTPPSGWAQQQFAVTAWGILPPPLLPSPELSKRVNWHSKLPANDLSFARGKLPHHNHQHNQIVRHPQKSMLQKVLTRQQLCGRRRACVTHVFCQLQLFLCLFSAHFVRFLFFLLCKFNHLTPMKYKSRQWRKNFLPNRQNLSLLDDAIRRAQKLFCMGKEVG